MLETLLPPNSTAQERALEQAMRPGEPLRAAVDLVRTAKENPPDGWLLWLVWEYGLEELLPYLTDLHQLIQQGLQWQRIRGTPGSVTMALDWVPLPDASIREEDPLTAHWYEFQVDPGLIPTRQQLVALVGLARLSAPVGTRLSRVFHGYDFPRAVYDFTAWSDGSLYSDHSGVYDPDLDVDLSFGDTAQAVVSLGDPAIHVEVGIQNQTRVAYIDRQLYDFAEYDEPPLLNYRFQVEHQEQFICGGIGRNLKVLDGTFTLDGSVIIDGGLIPERPQWPFKVTTGDMGGGVWTGGWTARTWMGT